MSRYAVFVLFAVFVGGLVCGVYTAVWCAVVFLAAGVTAVILSFKCRERHGMRLAACLFAVFAAGACIRSIQCREEKNMYEVLPYYHAVDVCGVANEISSPSSYGSVRVTLHPVIISQIKNLSSRYSMHCNVDTSRHIRMGDTVRGRAVLLPIRAAVNPDMTDYAAIYRRDGVIGVVNGRDMEVRHAIVPYGTWREKILGKAESSLEKAGLSPVAVQNTMALLWGDKKSMSRGMKEAYSSSGVIHLFTVSGMHVGMVALMVWGMTFFLRRHRWIRTACVMAALFLYGYITGWEAPVTRAVWMFAFLALAACDPSRKGSSLNALGLAGILYLVFHPQEVASAGFQMSYAATTAIILFYPSFSHWKKSLPRVSSYLLITLCTTVTAQVAVLPFVIYYFGKIHLLFPLTNLLMIPYVTLLLFPAGGVVTLCSLAGWDAGVLYDIYEKGCEWAYLGSAEAAGWDGMMIRNWDVSLCGAVGLACICTGVLLLWKKYRRVSLALVLGGMVIYMGGHVYDAAADVRVLCCEPSSNDCYISCGSGGKIPLSAGDAAVSDGDTLCRADDWRYDFPQDGSYTVVAGRFFHPDTVPGKVVILPYASYSHVMEWMSYCHEHDIPCHDMRKDGFMILE